MEQKAKIKEFSSLIAFFVFELLSLVAFTLGNSIILYSGLSIAIAIFVIFTGYKEFKKKESMSFLIFLIPLFIFGALTAFSPFSLSNVSIIVNILSFLGIMSFALIGYLSKSMPGFKISTALLIIYGSLAVLVFLSLLLTMIAYVPFYPFIYNGMAVYYNGTPYPAYTDAKQLMGFAFSDVSLEYFSLFSTLLFTSVVALRFINRKENRLEFVLYCVFAALGLLSLVLTINKINAITDVLVIFFLLFVTFYPKKGMGAKVLKYLFFVGLVCLFLAFVVFFINSQSEWTWAAPIQNMISGSGILNKVFNTNRISLAIKNTLDGCITSGRFFGYSGPAYVLIDGSYLSKSFIFDSILTSGVLGALSLVIFIVFSYFSLKRYYVFSKDNDAYKNLIIAFIGTFLIYGMFALESSPETHNIYIQPLTCNAMFLITLFLVGYSYTAKKRETEVIANA